MASSDVLVDIVESFNDVEQLKLWARTNGLEDEVNVKSRLRKLEDRDKIYSFTDIGLLKQWALTNDKIFDLDVRNRLHQLELNVKIIGHGVCISIIIIMIIIVIFFNHIWIYCNEFEIRCIHSIYGFIYIFR